MVDYVSSAQPKEATMRRLNEHTWEATFDLKLSPGVYFPTRMTIVDAGGGDLLLHSPIPIDDALEAEIQALGVVRWIFAPNDLHHMYLPGAAARFPQAKVFGTPGAIRKRRGVEFAGSLGDGAPDDLPESVVAFEVGGIPAIHETVLWLPDVRTVVCSDLVFNIREPKTWLTSALLKLVIPHDPPAQSRTFRWFFVKDRRAYAESVAELASRSFDTLVMGHGQVVETGGDAALRRALDWAIDHDAARLLV
jgi:hypothetical protein